MKKAILLQGEMEEISQWKKIENENTDVKLVKYYTTETLSNFSNNISINNIHLSLLSTPTETLEKLPEEKKDISKLTKGDLILLSDTDNQELPLLVMVWEVNVAMNTFYGYPVVENVDLATESSEIRIYNEGLPIGWDFAILYEFGEEYDFSSIDEEGYFGAISLNQEKEDFRKGRPLAENFDYREYELITLHNLTKYYASLSPNSSRKNISPNPIIKSGFEDLSFYTEGNNG